VLDVEGGLGGNFVRRLRQWRDRRLVHLYGSRRYFRTATPPNAGVTGDSGGGLGHGRRGGGPATTRRGSWSSLLFGTGALLTLPACAHARNLVVSEQTQMTANGNVHLTK
jgi:hypothetical protein